MYKALQEKRESMKQENELRQQEFNRKLEEMFAQWKMEDEEKAKHRADKEKELGEANTARIVSICEDDLREKEGKSVVELKEPENADAIVDVAEAFVNDYVENEEEHLDLISVEAKVDAILQHSCSDLVDSSMQVLEDDPYKKNLGLLNSSTTAPVLHENELLLVGNRGKPVHTFVDPFMDHEAVSPQLNWYDYVAVDHSVTGIFSKRRYKFQVGSIKHGARNQQAFYLKWCIQRLFDPGIAMMYIVVVSRLVCVADLYDVLLIRGRILLNRVGMI